MSSTPLGEKETPLGEKETPPGEKVTIFVNAFLSLLMLSLLWSYLKKGRAMEAWDHSRRRGTIVATRGWDGDGFGRGLLGRVGLVFEGTGRGSGRPGGGGGR